MRVGRSPEADEALTALVEAKPSIACLVRRLDVYLEDLDGDGVERVGRIITAATGLVTLSFVSAMGRGRELVALSEAALRGLGGRTLRMLSVPAIVPAGCLEYECLRQLVLSSRPAERRFTVVGGAQGDTVDAAGFLNSILNPGQPITLDGRLDSDVIDKLSDAILEDVVYIRAGILDDGELRGLPLARCKNLRRLDMAGLNFMPNEHDTLPDSLQCLQLAHPLDETEGLASMERLGTMLANDELLPRLRELDLRMDEYDVYNSAFDESYSWRADDLTPEHEAALAEVRRQCVRRGIDLHIALPAE